MFLKIHKGKEEMIQIYMKKLNRQVNLNMTLISLIIKHILETLSLIVLSLLKRNTLINLSRNKKIYQLKINMHWHRHLAMQDF